MTADLATPIDIARHIREGDTVAWSSGAAEPTALLQALNAQIDRVPACRAFIGLSVEHDARCGANGWPHASGDVGRRRHEPAIRGGRQHGRAACPLFGAAAAGRRWPFEVRRRLGAAGRRRRRSPADLDDRLSDASAAPRPRRDRRDQRSGALRARRYRRLRRRYRSCHPRLASAGRNPRADAR